MRGKGTVNIPASVAATGRGPLQSYNLQSFLFLKKNNYECKNETLTPNCQEFVYQLTTWILVGAMLWGIW